MRANTSFFSPARSDCTDCIIFAHVTMCAIGRRKITLKDHLGGDEMGCPKGELSSIMDGLTLPCQAPKDALQPIVCPDLQGRNHLKSATRRAKGLRRAVRGDILGGTGRAYSPEGTT